MKSNGELHFYWKMFQSGGSAPHPGTLPPTLPTNLDQKQVFLGLFLNCLLKLPASQWTVLPSELVSIAVDHLNAPHSVPWLEKLLFQTVLQLQPEQISDHRLLDQLLNYVAKCLTKLPLADLRDLLNHSVVTEDLTLREVPLLTRVVSTRPTNATEDAGDSMETTSSSSPPVLLQHCSSILDKYNQLLQQQQNQGDNSDKGENCNSEGNGGGRLSGKQTNSLLRLIESEIPAKELILLPIRFIVNTLRDRSATNYCKDYQLCAIIVGALGHYQHSAAGDGRLQEQCHILLGQFWSTILAAAVLESFTPTPIARRKPIELVSAVDRVLDRATVYLNEGNSQGSPGASDYHWTFLAIYLINNLQFSCSGEPQDQAKQSGLWTRFNDLQGPIQRTTARLLATIHTQVHGSNIVKLLAKCLENFKKSPLAMTSGHLRNRRRRRQRGKNKRSVLFRSCDSIHHQPMLGSYRRFDCIAEQCLIALSPLISDTGDQAALLKCIAKVGLCCCSANRRTLSVLCILAYTPALSELCLHILRYSVYSLWFSRPGECRLCGERLNDNECLQNEILLFYREAIERMPARRALMLHILSSLRLIPFSMRMSLVLEVVWRHFCDEMDGGAEEEGQESLVTSDSLRSCLLIFARALQHDRELVQMFVTDASVLRLIGCRSKWPKLMPFVCDIFVSALEHWRQFDAAIMDKLLDSLVLPCVEASQRIVWFLGGRAKKNEIFGAVGDTIEEEETETGEALRSERNRFFKDEDVEGAVREAVVLWRTLGRIIELNEEEIDEYLEEHFMHRANVFHIICLAIVFVLDVNAEVDRAGKVLPPTVEEIVRKLDSLRVDSNCDTDAFLLREVKTCDGAKVQTTAIDGDISYAYQQVSVFPVASFVDVTYAEVMKGCDPQCPYSCDIFLDYFVGREGEVEDKMLAAEERNSSREAAAAVQEKVCKRDSLSLVESVYNTVKEKTGRLIHQYVGDHWKGSGHQEPKDNELLIVGDRPLMTFGDIGSVNVTAELRLRVGQLLDAALKVFVVMNSDEEEFGVANMLSALSELKRYILVQSIEGWSSVEHARTVTRTLEAILKVAEVRRRRRTGGGEDCRHSSDGGIAVPRGSPISVFASDSEEDEGTDLLGSNEGFTDADADDAVESIAFTTTRLDSTGTSLSPGYDADSEQPKSSSSNEFIGPETDAAAGDQCQLNEGVCQIVMEILFELSKKCVADPSLWSNSLNAVLNQLAPVVRRSLGGGTEALLRGFAAVLESNDGRLRELQGSILALVPSILTPASLTAYMSLFTAERPPVELLLPKFYESTVAKMELREPVCEMEFPTRNDATQRVLCDPVLVRGVLNVHEYHRKVKFESPFTRSALIYPMPVVKFQPWTNSGFTVATWMKWTESCVGGGGGGCREALNVGAEQCRHVWSVGSDKVLMSLYLNCDTGQMSVEVTRPSATLTKEMVQRARRGNGNSSNGNGTSVASKRNLFMKTMRVEGPWPYRITKHALPVGRQLAAHHWQHLAWSVAIFPDQIVLVMTVAGAEQFTVHLPLENGLHATKTSAFSVLCVGETCGSLWPGSYSMTGVMLFKKSIPELQVLAVLMGYGPDLTHPAALRCQVEQIVPNGGLVGRAAEAAAANGSIPIENRGGAGGSPIEMDEMQVVRENLLVSLSAQNVDLVPWLEQEVPLGCLAFGEKVAVRRNRSFATNLVVSGGLDVLLYLFARVVELRAGAAMQALALRTVLEAAHRNMYLFSDFKRRHSDAISSVIRAAGCDKSLHMLKIILDVAFDGSVLEVRDGGRSYKIVEQTRPEWRLLYPELIISTINNFDAWIDERGGEETVIEVLFEVLIWLNVSSVRGGAYSKRQLVQANVLGAVLNFCKMHVGGISSRIRVTSTMAERLVELLGIYGPAPPGADFLDELAKLLLLIQEPSCVFVTQDRVNYYYLLAACPPSRGGDRMRPLTRTAQRWTSGWRMIRNMRKRRPTVASSVESEMERSLSSSQETLLKPRRSSLWERGGERVDAGGGDALVAGEEPKGEVVQRVKRSKRRISGDVREMVFEMATVREGDKVAAQRIRARDVVRVNRVVHNRKVAQRRRTIERRTPLYNRLRAHVRKKENQNCPADDWSALNLRRLSGAGGGGGAEGASSGAGTLQMELLRLLRSYMILLPDNMVAGVLEHYVTLDLLIILGNSADGGVRSQLLRLLCSMCDRMDAAKFHQLLEGWRFVHLANQLVIHPVTLEMVLTCRQWVQEEENGAEGETTTPLQQSKRNVGLIFLVAMLPRLVERYEGTLVGCLQLLSELYEVCPATRKFLMLKALLIPTLVKCWGKVYAKRPFLNLLRRPGSHLLMFSYQICKSLFLSTGSTAPPVAAVLDGGVSMGMPTIWDLLNGLDFVGTSSLAVPVRRGMRVIQAKIFNGLLRQCLRERTAPHERYMRGLRRLPHVPLRNGKGGGGSAAAAVGVGGRDVKAMFHLLMERSILLVQCKDSQHEPRAAEEDLVKTIIRLGLATRLKIGTVITWAMSPFRSIDLRLFVIKCLTHLMKSKHVKTYGLNISIIRIFTKKFVGDVVAASTAGEVVTESNLVIVRQFARFLNTDTSVDLWALLKAMSKIDEISCRIQEDRAPEIERSVHKYEAVAADAMELSVQLTRRFVEAQNTERRDLINQLRAEKRHNYQWRPLINRMTHENAPFHNARYFPDSWQMDETEGPSRVRLRMQRCFPASGKFLLPEFRELHAHVAAEPPLQFLVAANVKSRSSIVDQVLYNFPAAQITGDMEVNGDLVITEAAITFLPEPEFQREPLIVEVSTVIDIFLRRYLHEQKGVELFLTSGRTLLFLLHEAGDRKTFEAYFADKVFDTGASGKWHMFVLQQWREGQLTNWEYLTALNQLGGRSFQDVMQYPVFPWVLADYQSSVLDLRRRESFRNFERPIAVQTDEGRAHYEADYEHLVSSSGGHFNVSHFPYHFPCHYSNSGTVFGFLVRVQPYTQMFVRYQDGHFDLPDRTFFSMQHAWRLASRESKTDVKELLPEFFTLPEMFENGEGFDFGRCQSGERVDHVHLPAWSNHSARLFTLVHRQALESDVVRDSLRHWVDLIFGYKQAGEEAIRATNVFHSATYPEYAHPPNDDPLFASAYATMIRSYGQMPRQLLSQPHPESLVGLMAEEEGEREREVEDQIVASHCSSVRGLRWGKYAGSPDLPAPVRVELMKRGAGPEGGRRLVGLDATNTVYVVPEHANLMQGLEADTTNCVTWRNADSVVRIQRMTCSGKWGGEAAGELFVANDHLDAIRCCGTHVQSNQLWLGYASGRIVVYQVLCNGGSAAGADKLNKMRYLQKSYLANTMSYNSAFRMFKSTGTGGTGVTTASSSSAVNGGSGGVHSWQQQRPARAGGEEDINRLKWTEEVTLLFHSGCVVDIRISPEFRIAVSVGVDGRAAIWDTNRLEFVRQIEPPTTATISAALSHRIPIALLAISQTMGDIVTVHRGREQQGEGEEDEQEEQDDESYEVTENNIDDFVRVSTSGFAGGKKTLLRLHTINGKYVNHVTVPERILCVAVSHVKEGTGINVVATGFEGGTIKLWSSWDLSFVRQVDTHLADVLDLCFSTYQHLVVLTDDDFIQVWESPGLLGNAPKFPQVECKRW